MTSAAALPSCYLFVVLLVPQPFDLGVVDRQIPAVGFAQLVAAATEQGLPLWRHWLQQGQHCPAALWTAGLTGHFHRAAVVQVAHWTLKETHMNRADWFMTLPQSLDIKEELNY